MTPEKPRLRLKKIDHYDGQNMPVIPVPGSRTDTQTKTPPVRTARYSPVDGGVEITAEAYDWMFGDLGSRSSEVTLPKEARPQKPE